MRSAKRNKENKSDSASVNWAVHSKQGCITKFIQRENAVNENNKSNRNTTTVANIFGKLSGTPV